MTYFLAADTISGVYPSRTEGESSILYNSDFFEALNCVKEGEVIYGCVDSETCEKISREYGIRAN